jgi:membrane-associated phospholipid phosphatase
LPIIKNGGELARLFENETPGLWHRHVLNVLFDPNIPNSLGQRFSPPLQAFIWAALDVAIASALMAVWHYKWLATGLNQVARRARPVEANPGLGVLYDFEVEFVNTGQNGRQVGDIVLGQPKNAQIASPGTPRHPAYGSGHSTYSAAASYVLVVRQG